MDRTTLQSTADGVGKKPSQNGAPLIPILGIAVVVLAILVLWLFFSGRPPRDDSVEAGFARDMSVHHAQAVEMAEIVRDKTESEEIRLMAADMALTQQAQIGQMQGWLAAWGLPPTGPEPAMAWMGHPTEGRMPGMATPEEIQRLQDAPPEEADRLFLEVMIPHHRAAVPMAQAALDESDRPEVEQLAGAVVSSQKGEIEIMQQMLEEQGADRVAQPAEGSNSHGGHEH